MNFSSNKKAFSLLEIIVVIAILMVLMALVFPTIKRVNHFAERQSCIANIRHSGSAFFTMLGDSGGRVPLFLGGAGSAALIWGNQLYERGYLDEEKSPYLRCEQGNATDAAWHWRIYGMTALVPKESLYKMADEKGIINTMFDMHMDITNTPSDYAFIFDSVTKLGGVQSFRITTHSSEGAFELRHDGKANILFLDGHVETLGRKEIEKKMESSDQITPTWEYIVDKIN